MKRPEWFKWEFVILNLIAFLAFCTLICLFWKHPEVCLEVKWIVTVVYTLLYILITWLLKLLVLSSPVGKEI